MAKKKKKNLEKLQAHTPLSSDEEGDNSDNRTILVPDKVAMNNPVTIGIQDMVDRISEHTETHQLANHLQNLDSQKADKIAEIIKVNIVKRNEHKTNIDRLTKDLTNQEKQVISFQNDIKHQESKINEIELQKQKLNWEKTELSNVLDQKTKTVNELEKEIVTLAGSNLSKHNQLLNTANQLATLNKKCQEKENEISHHTARMTKAKADNESMHSKYRELHTRSQEMIVHIDQQKRELAELISVQDSLKEEHVSIKVEYDKLQRELNDEQRKSSVIKCQIEEKDREIQIAQQKFITQENSHQKDCFKMEQNLQKQYSKYDLDIKEQKDKYNQQEVHMTNLIKTIEEKQNFVNQLNDSINNQEHILEEERKTNEITLNQLKTDIQEKNIQVTQYKTELANLQKQIQNVIDDKSNLATKYEMAEQSKVNSLEKVRLELTSIQDAKKIIEQKFADQFDQIDVKNRCIATTKESLMRTSKEHNEAVKRLQKVEKEFNEQVHNEKVLQTKVVEFEKLIQDKENRLEQATVKTEQLEQEKQEIHQKHTVLTIQVADLKKELEKSKELNTEYQQTIKTLNQKEKEYRSLANDLEKSKAILENQSQTQTESLEREREALNIDMERVQLLRTELTSRLTKLDEMNQEIHERELELYASKEIVDQITDKMENTLKGYTQELESIRNFYSKLPELQEQVCEKVNDLVDGQRQMLVEHSDKLLGCLNQTANDEKMRLVSTFENKMSMIDEKISKLDLIETEFDTRSAKLRYMDECLEEKSKVYDESKQFFKEQQIDMEKRKNDVKMINECMEIYSQLNTQNKTDYRTVLANLKKLHDSKNELKDQVLRTNREVDTVVQECKKTKGLIMIEKMGHLEENVGRLFMIFGIQMLYNAGSYFVWG